MLQNSNEIYAFNSVPDSWREIISRSLRGGEGRFGWSYGPDMNLIKLNEKLNSKEELTETEIQARKCRFLLDLKDGDYVVYINLPEYGKCTLAKVKSAYYFKKNLDDDFNHCFEVYPESIREFGRNDAIVNSDLCSRLKLQNKYWRIYSRDSFNRLLNSLENGYSPETRNGEHNIDHLIELTSDKLLEICMDIHKSHNNFDLEKLMEKVFKNMKIDNVERIATANDIGTDIVLTVKEGIPGTGLEFLNNYLVQIKSYQGEISDKTSINQIKRSYEEYNSNGKYENIRGAIIVTTATTISKEYEEYKDKVEEEIKIPIKILYGKELSLLIFKYLD